MEVLEVLITNLASDFDLPYVKIKISYHSAFKRLEKRCMVVITRRLFKNVLGVGIQGIIDDKSQNAKPHHRCGQDP